MKTNPKPDLFSKRRPAHGRAEQSRGRMLIATALLPGAHAGCMKGASILKWTEDVLLPDGRTMAIKRYQEFKGLGEIRQPSYYWFKFNYPDTGEFVRWESKREPGMVALFVPKYSAMLLACPQFGSGRRGFGCSNPPCLLYRYASGKWESVDLSLILFKRLRSNMTYTAGDRVAEIKSDHGHLSAATTSNARCQNLPWVMDLADVEQAFDQSDCVHKVNVVLINERNEPGAEK